MIAMSIIDINYILEKLSTNCVIVRFDFIDFVYGILKCGMVTHHENMSRFIHSKKKKMILLNATPCVTLWL